MNFVVPFLAVGALAASANAGINFVTVNSVNAAGNNVSDVYVNFGAGSGVVLNIFGVQNISGSATFVNNDFAGGVLNPQLNNAFGPGNDATGINDTFVSIGGTDNTNQANTAAGFGNTWTNADPGFGGAGLNQPGIPNGAGWFNGNPPNLAGKSFNGLTFIGRFVISGDAQRTYFAKFGYNAGISTPTQFGEGEFTVGIPAPGALALLGLAGLAGRRRRA